ncbi:hypothetical protein [Clostridium intestinale]|jgi:hypothetical protein|uniref:Uncharacterized protein n=2 Tax=Clostridium intestinale TaxID=36845 RepID=U2PTV5_9CLOT|nr:hypothetical protein [Clostridium intestinale]ERK29880.1 hypothetical protein CINTURNW_2888 [Clostridium intestinale URNW]QLY81149.1 hypothetical protein HZF06_06055 [Clostridium intestinale]
MSQCPFWSINGEKINCYSECPIHDGLKADEICPFKELVDVKNISMSAFDRFSYEEEFNSLDLPKISVYK